MATVDAPSTELAFDLSDPAERGHVQRLRSRGLDDDGVRFCMAERGLERIIENNRGLKRHVLITCTPKSASTYLSELLLHATGFRRYFLAPVGEDQERQIDRRSIPMFLASDTVSQEHLKANGPDIRLLKRMEVRPIVLVRDIFDSIVSLHDQVLREPYAPWPMAYWPAQFRQWAKTDRLWFLVEMVTPWYLSFFASWRDAGAAIETLWLTFEDVVARANETVHRVAGHCGIGLPDQRIDEAMDTVDMTRVRMNRGASGRGRTELNTDQRRAIRRLADRFGGAYDFSLIGLAHTDDQSVKREPKRWRPVAGAASPTSGRATRAWPT